ncbi:cation-binding protein [Geotalea uraniireducens]|uniref:Cation-binding protein n=1 Tax=Geotalea uraniireducens TaxID=351604 RepID=A0ABM8EP08_9BACT|nr:hemerythrin domain-containing protein [Geotalea uraniireducens]BDV44187.1 cation-binding protein [Geotalea uraniireducens]
MTGNITDRLIDEHRLILRMLTVLEKRALRVADGAAPDAEFFLAAVDFIRNYADRFHHAKEEDILFAALVANGMPREHSPVAAMLLEHEEGRAHVRALEAAALAVQAGESGRAREIAEHAIAYLELLREHIDKEDHILYPLAERLIPVGQHEAVLAGYAAAAKRAPAGFEEHYRQLVARYEAAALRPAA